MTLKIIELSDRYMKFYVDGITPAIANALRRTLINDIPKLAIEKVTFRHGEIRDTEGNVYDSSLPLFDEVVAHRLAMIPLITDLKMNFRDQCSCGGKGCPLCTVTYSINKVGPAIVTSADLQPVDNPYLVPADKEIPIVKLGPKQGLLLTAQAIMGRGKDHAKWQVTSGVAYKYHREFIVDKSQYPDWVKAKESCPSCVLREDEKEIVFTDDYGFPWANRLFENRAVRIVEDDTRFIFQFETDGSLKAIDVLDYALRRLQERLNTLAESMSAPD